MDTPDAAVTDGATPNIIDQAFAPSIRSDALDKIYILVARGRSGIAALRAIEKLRVVEPAEDFAIVLADAALFVGDSLHDIFDQLEDAAELMRNWPAPPAQAGHGRGRLSPDLGRPPSSSSTQGRDT